MAPSPLPKIFLWKLPETSFNDTSTEMITLYHPFGYGGITLSDCVTIENFTEALCMAFKGDNRGPHNVSEVIQVFQNISLEFPNAEIIGTFFYYLTIESFLI